MVSLLAGFRARAMCGVFAGLVNGLRQPACQTGRRRVDRPVGEDTETQLGAFIVDTRRGSHPVGNARALGA